MKLKLTMCALISLLATGNACASEKSKKRTIKELNTGQQTLPLYPTTYQAIVEQGNEEPATKKRRTNAETPSWSPPLLILSAPYQTSSTSTLLQSFRLRQNYDGQDGGQTSSEDKGETKIKMETLLESVIEEENLDEEELRDNHDSGQDPLEDTDKQIYTFQAINNETSESADLLKAITNNDTEGVKASYTPLANENAITESIPSNCTPEMIQTLSSVGVNLNGVKSNGTPLLQFLMESNNKAAANEIIKTEGIKTKENPYGIDINDLEKILSNLNIDDKDMSVNTEKKE